MDKVSHLQAGTCPSCPSGQAHRAQRSSTSENARNQRDKTGTFSGKTTPGTLGQGVYPLSRFPASKSGGKITLFPPPEHGVHGWIYGRACYLHARGVTEPDAIAAIVAALADTPLRPGRVVTIIELAEAVAAAFNRTSTAQAPAIADYDPDKGWPATFTTPREKLDPMALGGLLVDAKGFGLAALASASGPIPATVKEALSHLFGPADLLCIGQSQSQFAAKSLSAWSEAELATSQLIVPSPLRKATGTTAKGTVSAHCRDTVGPRRYIIVESDAGLSLDEQAAELWLAREVVSLKLRLVVFSGGKSIHGWFDCANLSAAQITADFAVFVKLGADPRLLLPEQFVRLPGGRRENGKHQAIVWVPPTPPPPTFTNFRAPPGWMPPCCASELFITTGLNADDLDLK